MSICWTVFSQLMPEDVQYEDLVADARALR